MVLPVSYWKLSERAIFKHFLSTGDAIEIPIMMYDNPATSGIDMSPELLVRMSETIDNVRMVKESTGDLSRMQRIDQLSGRPAALLQRQ
jgi:4-hydroxy-tetrahydrodipicolinate synthase